LQDVSPARFSDGVEDIRCGSGARHETIIFLCRNMSSLRTGRLRAGTGKVVRQALPERFVHRFPAAGHRNDRRGDPRREAGSFSDTGGINSVLSYAPSVTSATTLCKAATTHKARHRRAPRFPCFLASVPIVRGSVMVKSSIFGPNSTKATV
jgi:hypothetical protein